MHIEIYPVAGGAWCWRGVDAENRIVCEGGETYISRDNVEAAVDRVVIGFRGALQVVARERRGTPRTSADRPYETLVIAEYQAEGELAHAEES